MITDIKNLKFVQDILPDNLSGLVRVSLRDEQRVYDSKDYILDMGLYHMNRMHSDVCSVCNKI